MPGLGHDLMHWHSAARHLYDFPFPQVNGSQVIFMGVCALGTQVTATDANGCSVTFPVAVTNSPGGWPDINYILPECGSTGNGVAALLDNYFTGAWYKVSITNTVSHVVDLIPFGSRNASEHAKLFFGQAIQKIVA